MGGFGSTRWAGHIRRFCVEECGREAASACPECDRACRFIYQSPADASRSACRLCLGLTYLSRQRCASLRGDMLRVPGLLADTEAEAFSLARRALEHPSLAADPPTNCTPGEMARFAHDVEQRDLDLQRAVELFTVANSVPSRLVRAVKAGNLKAREPKRRLVERPPRPE